MGDIHAIHDSYALGSRQGTKYNQSMVKKVIFVCSANYYRSRYAEYYFNWLAEQEKLGWEADSRGLMVGTWGNIGPISSHTAEALERRGIPLKESPRDPKPLTLTDLAEADLVVAVKEAEHRARWPSSSRSGSTGSSTGTLMTSTAPSRTRPLPHLESQIHELVERLRAADNGNGRGGNGSRHGS